MGKQPAASSTVSHSSRDASSLYREMIQHWRSRLDSIPSPTRDELLRVSAPTSASAPPPSSLASSATSTEVVTEPSSRSPARTLGDRLAAFGIGGLLATCPAAKDELTLLARGLEALAEVSATRRTLHPALAELRDQHTSALALSIQLVSSRLYWVIERIRCTHATVLSVGDAFDSARSLARCLGESLLGQVDAVTAVREGAAFVEREMLLVPGKSLQPGDRVAPLTFGVAAAGVLVQPRKAIVMPLEPQA